MAHKPDSEIIQHTHNTARFFVEHRQVALVLLLGTIAWGWYGFAKMPKRKDPIIPVRVAVASCKWPGATAEEIEQLITRPIEQTMAQNQAVKPPSGSDYGIRSLSFPSFALVFVQLDENVKDTLKQLNDINLRLNDLSDKLPQGAGPIQFNSNFGDTAALMLTVASPPASDVDVALRARTVKKAIEKLRAHSTEECAPTSGQRRGLFSPVCGGRRGEDVVPPGGPTRGPKRHVSRPLSLSGPGLHRN